MGNKYKKIPKKAFARVSIITKLKYAGVNTEGLMHIYKQIGVLF